MAGNADQELPLVSIVIPVYNGSNFLSQAIDSALSQTYPAIEVVVVNDGSTDNGESERAALSYGNKIHYYLKANGGVASALNFGIKKMSGEYFSWLSHDDLYEATKIEEEIAVLLSQPDPANTVVACNSLTLYENGMKRKDTINQAIFDNYFNIFLGASAKTGINGCSLLIPRHLLLEAVGFREDLPVTQDYDLWYRLSDDAQFVLLARHLVTYRHHEMQDSIQKFTMSLMAGDDLRSTILQHVPAKTFALFMDSHKRNKKWIWENYHTYKVRGGIKTPLAILFLLARYYYDKGGGSTRVQSEILAFEQRYGSGSHVQDDAKALYADKALMLIRHISDKDYRAGQDSVTSNTVLRYLQSVKNDGFLFMAEKAARKIIRMGRRG
ncbi:hypothetical protein BGO17_04285 [Candidatus Saccharibacteria bacterium 49-20]|mgnify:CR=1 FL=1|nr:MAG: hypothetical protein BGO17_04285 [Candidatus Saccharibacteria bacterium 49-20]